MVADFRCGTKEEERRKRLAGDARSLPHARACCFGSCVSVRLNHCIPTTCASDYLCESILIENIARASLHHQQHQHDLPVQERPRHEVHAAYKGKD